MTTTSLSIEWCNLSSWPDDALQSAFHQFVSELAASYPSFPTPRFSHLPSEIVDQLPEYLISKLPGQIDDGSFSHWDGKRVFVFCDGCEEFALRYQDQNELAHWGVAIPCEFAIAWEPNTYLIWHELLHLMNAKDCYNKFGINKCPDSRCLMRRAPSRLRCGDRLLVCSRNIKRIQRHAAELAATREHFVD